MTLNALHLSLVDSKVNTKFYSHSIFNMAWYFIRWASRSIILAVLLQDYLYVAEGLPKPSMFYRNLIDVFASY